MPPENTLYVTNRQEWRVWLRKNGKREKEIWLIYYKKHTGKPRIPYDDAVEEALCYGWIDSTVKRLDDERYMQKFTPRKPNSVWSALNKNRVEKLTKQGRMTKAGLAKVEAAKKSGWWDKAYASNDVPQMSAELKKALQANKQARENFDNLAPSYKNQFIGWVASAKRAETRDKRVKEAVGLLARNKKLGLR